MSRTYGEKILQKIFRRLVKKNILTLIVVAFVGLSLFNGSSFIKDIFSKVSTLVTAQENSTKDDFQIHFLDVGQGDSTLIVCDGKTMLIDAGEVDKGNTVVKYLKKNNIKTLDFIIGTHPDSDHIGGLLTVIKEYRPETLFLSVVNEPSTVTENLKSYINDNGIAVTGPKVGETYMLGSASVRIVGPVDIYDEDNNNSISVLVTYHGKKFLFMGDTEAVAEKDIIDNGVDVNCDVLKLSHHGSSTSTTDILLQKASPEIAVISCGKDNKYGHPHIETLEKLLKNNITMYRTDLQGNVILYIENGKIVSNVEPCEKFISGNGKVAEIYTGPYILNTSSKKFHNPDCKNVSDIKDKNKEESNLSRNELINDGYSPCGYCKP